MGTVVLLIDNSNIFISGKDKYDDWSARFSYSEFEKICAGDDTIVEKHIAGSTPPSNDRFWTRMERKGYKVHTYERVSAGYGHTKEKGVDMILGMQGTRAIEKCKPDRVVLLTGDGDFVPIANLRDEIRAENGDSFILDVWAFSDALSPELKRVSDHVFHIEDFEEKLIYFQSREDCAESFSEHYARIEKEEAARRVALKEKLAAAEERAAREAALKEKLKERLKERAARKAALDEHDGRIEEEKADEIEEEKADEIEEEKVTPEKQPMGFLEKVGWCLGGVAVLGLIAIGAYCTGDVDI